jgi:hypothetical protein
MAAAAASTACQTSTSGEGHVRRTRSARSTPRSSIFSSCTHRCRITITGLPQVIRRTRRLEDGSGRRRQAQAPHPPVQGVRAAGGTRWSAFRSLARRCSAKWRSIPPRCALLAERAQRRMSCARRRHNMRLAAERTYVRSVAPPSDAVQPRGVRTHPAGRAGRTTSASPIPGRWRVSQSAGRGPPSRPVSSRASSSESKRSSAR